MLKDLILFQKAYDFLKWTHETVARFPKSEKFVLAQRTLNTALDLLSAGTSANASRENSTSSSASTAPTTR